MSIARTITIAAIAFGLAAPALAADPGVETITVRVARPADASPAAVRRLERRIAKAALEACGASPFSAPVVKSAVARTQCWHDSYASGIAQIDGGGAARADAASSPSPRAKGEP